MTRDNGPSASPSNERLTRYGAAAAISPWYKAASAFSPKSESVTPPGCIPWSFTIRGTLALSHFMLASFSMPSPKQSSGTHGQSFASDASNSTWLIGASFMMGGGSGAPTALAPPATQVPRPTSGTASAKSCLMLVTTALMLCLIQLRSSFWTVRSYAVRANPILGGLHHEYFLARERLTRGAQSIAKFTPEE